MPDADVAEAHAPTGEAIATALLERLSEWRKRRPGGRIFVLLDPHHPANPDDELDVEALMRRDISRRIEPVPRPDFGALPELLPQLLVLHEAGEHGLLDEPLARMLVDCARRRCASVNGAYVAGWLLSEAEAAPLARHLARSGELFDMARGKRRFFPLFEPYRLALCHDAAHPQGFIAGWLGPVEQWLFVDSVGTLRSIDRGTASQSPPARPHGALGPAMSAGQARVRLGRLVVAAARNGGVGLGARCEHRIDAAIVRALGMGLRRADDLVFFALNELVLRAGWAEHPEARRLIESVAGDVASSLAGQFTALDPATLEAIAADA